MDPNSSALQKRVSSRDSAFRLLNRITAGVAFGSVATVGALSLITSMTIPGTSPLAQSTTASTSTSSSTSSTSSGLSSTSGVTSSTGSVVAVSGGSHP